MMPFVKLHELINYGGYAANTAMDGFAASSASVMVVHSADDGVVPIEYGYDIYYKKYRDDPRFTFVRYEDKGHNSIFNASPDVYKDEINAELQEWADALGYDYKAAENKKRFSKGGIRKVHDRERCDRVGGYLYPDIRPHQGSRNGGSLCNDRKHRQISCIIRSGTGKRSPNSRFTVRLRTRNR